MKPKAAVNPLPMIVINDEEKSSSGILHKDYAESQSNATRGLDSPTKETVTAIMPLAAEAALSQGAAVGLDAEEERKTNFSRQEFEEEMKEEPLEEPLQYHPPS
mmetsp:Transcript_15567/g.23877  ORF Transcript_15567/g.23877 Transcript_15567/m.23877 type:complete len:104 (-) Transcript_15567:2896-3207(-)